MPNLKIFSGTNSIDLAKEITKKLRKILDYPKYANNVSKRLRETVLSQFTPETHARKIEKIYNSVLS